MRPHQPPECCFTPTTAVDAAPQKLLNFDGIVKPAKAWRRKIRDQWK
jgi:hypothetical protein